MKRNVFRASRILSRFRRIIRNDKLILSVLALVVGVVSDGAVIIFREGIDFI